MVEKLNQEIKENVLEDLKAAESDQTAKDALTTDGPEVTAAWQIKLLNANSDEVQLPKYDQNPGRFKIDQAWIDKQMNKFKIEHDVKKEDFALYEVIDRVVIKFIEAVLGKDHWAELNSGNEFLDNHSSRKILEYLETKFTEDQPVDIKNELELLNKEPYMAEGLGKYFATMQGV